MPEPIIKYIVLLRSVGSTELRYLLISINKAAMKKVKIIDLANIREVKVKRDNSTHVVADAVIADETGCMHWSLWDSDIDRLKIGDIVSITNAYAKEFRRVLQLNTGKYGEFVILPKEDIKVNVNKNVSIMSVTSS